MCIVYNIICKHILRLIFYIFIYLYCTVFFSFLLHNYFTPIIFFHVKLLETFILQFSNVKMSWVILHVLFYILYYSSFLFLNYLSIKKSYSSHCKFIKLFSIVQPVLIFSNLDTKNIEFQNQIVNQKCSQLSNAIKSCNYSVLLLDGILVIDFRKCKSYS